MNVHSGESDCCQSRLPLHSRSFVWFRSILEGLFRSLWRSCWSLQSLTWLHRIKAGRAVTWGIAVFTHGGGMNVLGLPLPLLMRTANLTDSQKQQIHAIFEARHASRKAEREQLKAAKEAIGAKFLSSGTVAASDMSSSVATITQLQDQMTNEQIQDAVSIRNVLTLCADRANRCDQGQARRDSCRDESAVGARRQPEPERSSYADRVGPKSDLPRADGSWPPGCARPHVFRPSRSPSYQAG